MTRPLISLHPVWEFVEQILPNNSQVIIVIISLWEKILILLLFACVCWDTEYSFQVSLTLSLCDLSVTWLIMSAMKLIEDSPVAQSFFIRLVLVPRGKLMCLLPDRKFSHPCCYLQHLLHPFRTSLSYHSLICLVLWLSFRYRWMLHPDWLRLILPPFLQHSISVKHSIPLMNVTYMMLTSFRPSFWAPAIILLSMPTNILNFLCQHHIPHQGHQWTLSTALFWKPI